MDGMDRTTNLGRIENEGAGFTWGEIARLYKVGEYTIAEYHPWKSEDCRCMTGSPAGYFEYHVWIGGKDTARSYGTLEAAMVGAIAYKYDGANSQADSLFCRALGIKAD